MIQHCLQSCHRKHARPGEVTVGNVLETQVRFLGPTEGEDYSVTESGPVTSAHIPWPTASLSTLAPPEGELPHRNLDSPTIFFPNSRTFPSEESYKDLLAHQ